MKRKPRDKMPGIDSGRIIGDERLETVSESQWGHRSSSTLPYFRDFRRIQNGERTENDGERRWTHKERERTVKQSKGQCSSQHIQCIDGLWSRSRNHTRDSCTFSESRRKRKRKTEKRCLFVAHLNRSGHSNDGQKRQSTECALWSDQEMSIRKLSGILMVIEALWADHH